MTEPKSEAGKDYRKKTDAQKQQEKDDLIKLWMGDVSQDKAKDEKPKADSP